MLTSSSFRALVLGLLVFIAACEPPPTPTPQERLTPDRQLAIETEVQQAYDALIDVSERLDADGAAELLSGDPHMVFASNGFMFGPKQQIVDEVLPGWAGGGVMSQDIRTDTMTLTVLSPELVAQSSVGVFTETRTDGSVMPPQRFVFTTVWHWENGGWKIMHLHQSFAAAG